MLIVFEGIDGCGKTTISKAVLEDITSRGLQAVRFYEPTNMEWGREIRRIFESGTRLSPEAELDLFLKDRRDDVKKQIEPALRQEKIVLLDRYYFSTASYQGAMGLDWRKIVRKNEAFCPKPNLVLFVKVKPEVCLKRIDAEGRKRTAPEQIATQRKIACIYEEMFNVLGKNGYNIITLDGEKELMHLKKEATMESLQAIARRY